MAKRVYPGPRTNFFIEGGPFDKTRAMLRSTITDTLVFRARGMKGKYVSDRCVRMHWVSIP